MRIDIIDNLPFISIEISYQGSVIDIPNILVDTGSATTILDIDLVENIGIKVSDNDIIHYISGIGGEEMVFKRRIDYIKIDDCTISDFEVDIGNVNYSFQMNGIVGLDYLIRSKSIINLAEMFVEFMSSLR